MRTLDDQVEPELAQKFLVAREALLSLRIGGRASSYYISEIGRAIDAGMFLTILMLSYSLLEIWLRDLLVIRKATQQEPKSKKELCWLLTKFDREIEGLERGMSLASMLNSLVKLDVLTEEEKREICAQFKNYRNPLMHGVSGRFIRENVIGIEADKKPTNEEMLLIEIFEGISNRSESIESKLDYEAYECFEFVVNFIANHPIPKKV